MTVCKKELVLRLSLAGLVASVLVQAGFQLHKFLSGEAITTR